MIITKINLERFTENLSFVEIVVWGHYNDILGFKSYAFLLKSYNTGMVPEHYWPFFFISLPIVSAGTVTVVFLSMDPPLS